MAGCPNAAHKEFLEVGARAKWAGDLSEDPASLFRAPRSVNFSDGEQGQLLPVFPTWSAYNVNFPGNPPTEETPTGPAGDGDVDDGGSGGGDSGGTGCEGLSKDACNDAHGCKWDVGGENSDAGCKEFIGSGGGGPRPGGGGGGGIGGGHNPGWSPPILGGGEPDYDLIGPSPWDPANAGIGLPIPGPNDATPSNPGGIVNCKLICSSVAWYGTAADIAQTVENALYGWNNIGKMNQVPVTWVPGLVHPFGASGWGLMLLPPQLGMHGLGTYMYAAYLGLVHAYALVTNLSSYLSGEALAWRLLAQQKGCQC